MIHNLIKTSMILGCAIFLGRISGFLRELCLASRLGVSLKADIVVLLLAFPDLITNLLLSGGFNVAFIPFLKNLTPWQSKKVLLKLMFLIGLLSLLGSFLIAGFPKLWAYIFLPGVVLNISTIKIPLLLTIFSMPIAMMSGALTSYLNANKKFFISGLGTFLFNFGIIITLLYPCRTSPLLKIGIGIFLGTMVRFIVQWLFQPKIITNQCDTVPQINKAFFEAFLLASLSASVTVLIPFVMRSACSFFGDGQISAFNYANKIVEIPIGIFITNVGIVLYSLMCEQNDNKIASQKQRTALRKTFLFSIAFLAFGLAFGKSILQFIYQRGDCKLANILHIYYWFVWLLFTMPLIAIGTIYTVQLNARNKIKDILMINIKSLLVFIFCLILAIYLHSFFILGFSLLVFYGVYMIQVILNGTYIYFFNRKLLKHCASIIFLACLGAYACKMLCINFLLYKIAVGSLLGASTIVYIYKYDKENSFNI